MSMDAEHKPSRVTEVMTQLSDDLSPSARNSVSRVLHALATTSNQALAKKLGIDPSTLSRMKTEKKNNGLTDLEMACTLIDALDHKVVPMTYESMDRDTAASMLHLSKCYSNRFETVDDLFHEEVSVNKAKLGY